MTHCDSSVRSARDEMRHHMDFLCELYEAQVAHGPLLRA